MAYRPMRKAKKPLDTRPVAEKARDYSERFVIVKGMHTFYLVDAANDEIIFTTPDEDWLLNLIKNVHKTLLPHRLG